MRVALMRASAGSTTSHGRIALATPAATSPSTVAVSSERSSTRGAIPSVCRCSSGLYGSAYL